MDIKKVKLTELAKQTDELVDQVTTGKGLQVSTENGEVIIMTKSEYEELIKSIKGLSHLK